MLRDVALLAEEIGYDDLMLPDHVLGVNTAGRPDWGARNTSADAFHDPFVAFGFLSAVCRRIHVSTQVLILAQRQAALAGFATLRRDTEEAGRDPASVGSEVWTSMGAGAEAQWPEEFRFWKQAGVARVTLNPTFNRNHHRRIAGRSFANHGAAIRRWHAAVADLA